MKVKSKSLVSEPWFTRHGMWVLGLFIFILYARSIGLSYSKLDDDFYIITHQVENGKWSSVADVFNEGVGGKRDILYRPVFRISFILENHLLAVFHPVDFGKAAIRLAHFNNILLHIIQACLLFQLLLFFSFRRMDALLASLLFAAHPIMTMAVAWVPGRNEMMLSIFMLSYFICFLKYLEKPDWKNFLLQFVFVFLALFTKENSVFIPVIAFLYLLFFKRNTLSKPAWVYPFLIWILGIVAWYLQRNHAIEEGYVYGSMQESISLFFQRFPAFIQYTGKIFLAVNLSVFPYIQDTSYIPGILSIIGLLWIIIKNKERDTALIGFGLVWYFLFIIPAFAVPKNLTNAMFEHRMYIPYAGMIFIVAGSLKNFKMYSDSLRKWLLPGLIVVCSLITFNYQNIFTDEYSFFKNAVEENPHSAQAARMYGMQLNSGGKAEEAIPYFGRALSLDSNEIFVNYYLADLLYMPDGDLDKAAYHLDREIKLNPFYLDTYGKRVYIAHQKKDYQTIKILMQSVLKMYPRNEISSLNLLISYIELGEKENASRQLERMKLSGIAVDSSLVRRVGDLY